MKKLLTALLVSLLFLSACGDKPTSRDPLQPAIGLAEWEQQANYAQFGGHRIAYWEAGDPSRETIVLIHGFPSAAWDWQHLWPTLARDYHVVALDLLGYGFSDKPEGHSYSLIEQADMVMGLKAHLGLDRFHLLAHDYGTSVAQEVLARQQDGDRFVISLGLLNGGLFPEAQQHNLTMNLLKSPLGPYLIKLQNQQRFSRGFSEVFGADTQPGQGYLEGYWRLLNQQDGVDAIPSIIQYIDERHDYRDRWVGALQDPNLPKRVIIGSEDQLSGENMLARYEVLIANPDVVRLPGIGHYPQLEAPQAVLAAYLDFLHQVESSRG